MPRCGAGGALAARDREVPRDDFVGGVRRFFQARGAAGGDLRGMEVGVGDRIGGGGKLAAVVEDDGEDDILGRPHGEEPGGKPDRPRREKALGAERHGLLDLAGMVVGDPLHLGHVGKRHGLGQPGVEPVRQIEGFRAKGDGRRAEIAIDERHGRHGAKVARRDLTGC